MEKLFSEKTGRKFINFSRKVLNKKILKEKIKVPEEIDFRKSYAIFITLKGKEEESSGSTTATYSIGDAIVRESEKALEKLKEKNKTDEKDLKNIEIELSILSDLEKIEGNILENFNPKEDGLMCKFFGYTGIILPETINKKDLTKTEFLEKLCEKTGIPKDYWKKPAILFYKFQTQVFREPKK